jgi:hypothetical protein
MVQIVTINATKAEDCDQCDESASCCYDHKVAIPHPMKQDVDVSEERRKEHETHRTICCTSLYVDKLSKKNYDIALPSLKMIFTLIPIIPVLLATEKYEKTGYFHTHFLFFTNNLLYNTKHYMSRAAETLKLKLWKNNMVIFMCQNIKSTPTYINYLKKDPKHIAGTQRNILNLFIWFEKKYIYPDETDTIASGSQEQVPITPRLGIIDYIKSKLKSGIETLQDIMKEKYCRPYLMNVNFGKIFYHCLIHFWANITPQEQLVKIVKKIHSRSSSKKQICIRNIATEV